MRTSFSAWMAAATLTMVACGGGEPPAEEESAGMSAADTVQMAMSQYDPANYDSISWDTPEDAVVRGSVVFSYSCRKCHGVEGHGDGGFVMAGDTLRPPDFGQPDWGFREDLDGLRQKVYVGTANNMPHWGLAGLPYRDIDAVARFIQDQLTGS